MGVGCRWAAAAAKELFALWFEVTVVLVGKLLTDVAATTNTKALPISQAYLATHINVFILFSIGPMFYKVLYIFVSQE